MNLEDWHQAVGISRNPFSDADWIDSNIYVQRVNFAVLSEVLSSTIRRESQIMLVTAPYGFGKTAFSDAVRLFFLHEEDPNIQPIVISQPEFNEIQFYKHIGNLLGVDFGKYWQR